MYYTILKMLLNALSGNIKIRQVHTECVAFYSTFNTRFCEGLSLFVSIFQSCSDFLLVSFLWHNILKLIYITEIYVYM